LEVQVTNQSDDDNAVRARDLLAAAGLSPTPEDAALLELVYPLIRSRADTLYATPLGYEP
jgi:hypothetical protein